MDGFEAPSSKIDLRFTQEKVIFAISDCSLNKNYSFYNLSRQEAKQFIDRLRHIEKMTWGQFSSAGRKNGLTHEDINSENYKMIDGQNSCDHRLVEKYYFHFRVEETDLYRVFGYQNKQLFYITHIDPKGEINH